MLYFILVVVRWIPFMCQSINFLCFLQQSISAPGSGIWSDGKDKNDGSQAHTWNVEVLIDIVKEVVSKVCVLFPKKTAYFPWKTTHITLTKNHNSFEW